MERLTTLIASVIISCLIFTVAFAQENKKDNTKQYFKTTIIWCENVCNVDDKKATNKIDNYLNDFQGQHNILDYSIEPILVSPNFNNGGIWGYLITIRYAAH